MSEYDFTLKYALSNAEADPEEFVGALMEEGCDDAIVGIGLTGRIALNFTREAPSAAEAVFSAMKDVKRAIPNVELIEATPDLVGLTDVANLLGFTRQNMRKIMLTRGGNFPAPTYEGKSTLWHLATILDWLVRNEQYHFNRSLLEVAEINMAINVSRERSNIDPELEERARAMCA